MTHTQTGLLIMAYGSPATLDELEGYYTHIRNGVPPSRGALDELRQRYLRIGGVSPLREITERQAHALERRMNAGEHARAAAFRTYVGCKHTAPSIEDAVEVMGRDGVRDGVALVLSPYVSEYGPRLYMERARAAAARFSGMRLFEVGEWGESPRFTEHWAQAVRAELATLAASERERTTVIFSAHSLPQEFPVARAYAGRVERGAGRIARAAGLDRWAFAWQSAGRTAQRWLGPDVAQVTRDLWRGAGSRTFIYCPIGFVADHLEVLYDDDVECRELVVGLGGRYLRPPMPNVASSFIACLAEAVRGSLRRRAAEPER